MRYSESLGEVGARGHSRGFERAAVENRERAGRNSRKDLRREEARICKVACCFLQGTAARGGNQEDSRLHWPRGAGWVQWTTGQGVAGREGHEGQRVLGRGEKVEVWGGAAGLCE